jgi:tripartite-type tricarboxylate transporter receptor subunit TctC
MKKFVTALFAVLCICQPVAAQDGRSFKIISSFPVGSGPDTLSRKIADELAKEMGMPVIVDNRPGGNGVLALNQALRESPDSYILYSSNDNMVQYPILTDRNLVDNFQGIKQAMWSELVLATGPGTTTLGQLAKTGTVNYGSWGVGSAPHVLGLEFSQGLGLRDPVHVPYRDYGAWFSDVSNGVLTFSFVTIASTHALEQAGKLRYHAVVGVQRNSRYPNVPTLQELTGQNIHAIGWAGFYVHKSVDPKKAQEIKRRLDRVYQTKSVIDGLRTLDYSYRNMSIQDFGAMIQQEQVKFRAFVDANRVSIK